MRKISYIAALLAVVVCLPSCEGCVRKASKKATELGISVVEGVSEALDEHGARVGEKAADALGAIAEGAGTSIANQLDKHAETVAGVAGRVLVQSFEGFENGIASEYYDRMEDVSITAAEDVVASVEFLGKISTKPVVDAYLVIDGAGTFELDFTFEDAGGIASIKKNAEVAVDASKKYTVVSFALSSDEEAKWAKTAGVKIKITRNVGTVESI